MNNTRAHSEVWTIPNGLSAIRILLILVFAWFFIRQQDVAAIVVLAIAGVTDFLDGYLARRWNQVTALGRILDPAADRILTVAVVLAFGYRGILPWALVILALSRDAYVGIALLWGKSRGVATPQVTRLGKWATGILYVLLPLSYIFFERTNVAWEVTVVALVIAIGLYWAVGIGYVRDVRLRVKAQEGP